MEQIEDLIRKYISGKCSEEEKIWLEQWYQSFDWSESNNSSDAEIERLGEETWLILQSKINFQAGMVIKEFRKQSFPFQWWAYAAAAIFVTAIAGYSIYFFKQDKQGGITDDAVKIGKVVNDVLPGYSKGNLVLGDGSVIPLDSAGNMQLTEKDGTNIAKLSGKLVYNDAAAKGKVLFNTLTTPRGGEYQLILPDGSKVWLNAASSLKFPTRFEGSERSVFLNGEAYFEVAKNAKMPFHVKLEDGLTVEVLGTHFNIMGYDDEGEVKTTLAEGIVKVIKGSKAVLVTASKQATMKKADNSLLVGNADVDKALAWKNGSIEFDGNNLPYIMRQISRWYDIDVTFSGEISSVKYNGTIRRQAPLSKVLEILKLAGVQFNLVNKKLMVTGG